MCSHYRGREDSVQAALQVRQQLIGEARTQAQEGIFLRQRKGLLFLHIKYKRVKGGINDGTVTSAFAP